MACPCAGLIMDAEGGAGAHIRGGFSEMGLYRRVDYYYG
jgi:hypothetical protein